MYINSEKGEKGANRAGKGQWFKTGGKKGGKVQQKGGTGDIRVCCSCGKTVHIAPHLTKGSWNRSLNAVKEDKGDISDAVSEDENELLAWCLLEESDNEQWQEVTRKKPKLKKKLDHESLLSVENNSGVLPRKVIKVKDNWVNISATLDTGAAASRDVLESDTGSYEHNKDIRCSKWR